MSATAYRTVRPHSTPGVSRTRDAALRPELAAAAGFLGLGRGELVDRLRAGATLAALAHERRRSLASLIETMVAIARARLDSAVAAGRLSGEARDDIVRDLHERIRDAANRTIPFPVRRSGLVGSGFSARATRAATDRGSG